MSGLRIFFEDQVTSPNGKSMDYYVEISTTHHDGESWRQPTFEESMKIIKSDNPIDAYIEYLRKTFGKYDVAEHFVQFLFANNITWDICIELQGVMFEHKDKWDEWRRKNPHHSNADDYIKEFKEFAQKYIDLGFKIQFNYI